MKPRSFSFVVVHKHVHDYLGVGVVADVNIRKHWHDFLQLEQESEKV